LLHEFRIDQRFLGIVKDMRECVVSLIEVAAMNPDGLFSHRGLIGISGGLVVIGERDTVRHHAQNQARVDFAVCVIIIIMI